MSWHADAACKGQKSDLFFPVKGSDPFDALAFCERCPVTEDCLQSALDLGTDPGGIWGGTSARQRLRMRRRAS